MRVHFVAICLAALFAAAALAQDSSTGVLRGRVLDPAGAPLSAASITLSSSETGAERQASSDRDGRFTFDLVPAGDYRLIVAAGTFAPYERDGIHIDPAQASEVEIRMSARQEKVTVSGETPLVETQSSSVGNVIEEQAIQNLPLNGRRFQDLALLTPGVTTDPRGLTSASNGDLAFGGLRGYHTQFFVDGSDNNNGFFAQARGRYRAPYQFSNEVVSEFTISTNSYGAEIGGAGGAVVNVVTKSGTNYYHGSVFDYFRDSAFNARPPFVDFKPRDRQQQFGSTLGGPIAKDRAFFFGGFDQHIFHVPQVVEFLNGSTVITPIPNGEVGDFEASDKALVFAAASRLDALAGEQHAVLDGNAGFAKVGVALNSHNHLTARLSTSRYYGSNNVFFDPASPIVNRALNNNGEEDVATESGSLALESAPSPRWISHLRVQFSRDFEDTSANSSQTLQKITGILDGVGRSDILPRSTRERRIHLAETVGRSGGRHDFKFGGELGQVWVRDYFPLEYGGEYVFNPVEVNPLTFDVVREGGLKLTPLRAYAHGVPRFYIQDFGSAVSHPDSRQYALFAQDAIRVNDHFALNLGVRYDLQTFRSDGLVSNPLWPDSGKVPTDSNNFAPRAGFAYSTGGERPLILRGGGGIFFTTVPQIYNAAVETNNGINHQQMFLDAARFPDNTIFPTYPNPLVNCIPGAATCAPPLNAVGLSADISAFAHNFQTPYVEQASASLEREVSGGVALEANYLFVHGVHLIRARDVNLPKPVILQYPVFDDSGTNFLGTFNSVASFATWQFSPTITCPFPPCINPLARPIPRLGAIDTFESQASSVYHGMTISARKRMRHGIYFRLGYTLAHAIDDTQDALITTAPVVQNSFDTSAERGNGVTDQRNRLVFSWVAAPRPFHREHRELAKVFDDWKLAGIVTSGSGRPVDARVIGDANQDGNSGDDRLPGVSRNSFVGPDYASTDLRLSRMFYAGDKIKLELMAESFNLFNRDNERVTITDNGFQANAAQFVNLTTKVNNRFYPASFRTVSSFLTPTSAYAPRQVQLAVKMTF